ncbi:10730_t:CDS:2, partial [Racocetra persica]
MPPFRRILSRPVVITNNTNNNKNTRTNIQTSLNKPRRLHKFGLHFQETASTIRHTLKPPSICSYCNAKLFSGETEGICCISGKVRLASTEQVAQLRDLFMRLDEMGNEFPDHGLDQRIYNTPTASQVAGIWVEGHEPLDRMKRDIIIKSKSNSLQHVSELN